MLRLVCCVALLLAQVTLVFGAPLCSSLERFVDQVLSSEEQFPDPVTAYRLIAPRIVNTSIQSCVAWHALFVTICRRYPGYEALSFLSLYDSGVRDVHRVTILKRANMFWCQDNTRVEQFASIEDAVAWVSRSHHCRYRVLRQERARDMF